MAKMQNIAESSAMIRNSLLLAKILTRARCYPHIKLAQPLDKSLSIRRDFFELRNKMLFKADG